MEEEEKVTVEKVKVARLIEIRLDHFKSFVDEGVLISPVTMLVGANASGKSNLFDAFRVLHGLGRGLSAAEILNGTDEQGRGAWPGIRGGDKEAAYSGSPMFKISTKWSIEDAAEFTYDVAFEVDPQLLIISEEMRVPGEEPAIFQGTNLESYTFPDRVDEIVQLRLRLRTELPEHTYMIEGVAEETTMLNRILRIANDKLDPRVREYSKALQQALRQFSFLELDPGRMRDYASKKIKGMGARGEHFSAAAWRLCKDEAKKQQLVDWISELCSPKVTDVDFVEVEELGDVILELVEEGGMRISARSLSDGTLRFLGLLIALMTSKPGETLLIEEPETGLHPARASLLVELLGTMVSSRGIRVIVTTHSPQVLLALQNLSLPALEQAIVFGRLSGVPGTVMKKLGDLPQFERIAKEHGVDHLFTTRWMEHAL